MAISLKQACFDLENFLTKEELENFSMAFSAKNPDGWSSNGGEFSSKVDQAFDIILGSFVWEDTIQGFRYWSDITDRLAQYEEKEI